MLDAALADGFFPGSRSVPASGVTPFGAEGYKTIAYEVVAALGRPPDVVVVPVGGGDGIYGIHRGFAELKRAGDIPSIPRMVGVRTNASHGALHRLRSGGVARCRLRSAVRRILCQGHV